MEDNPLLPFTVAMTVGVSLAILARAALSAWRHGNTAHRDSLRDTWDTPASGARLPSGRAGR